MKLKEQVELSRCEGAVARYACHGDVRIQDLLDGREVQEKFMK